MSLTPGAQLGPYEVLSRLGAGGMGEVYRARDTRLDRIVALKVLPADRVTDAEARGRFEREAKAVAALSHPNICAIHDVGLADATAPPFLVMELLDGQTLQDRLMRGPLEIDQIIDLGAALADALDCAHTRGLIHRDLKPANIFLTTRGIPKILDFGLAKALQAPGGHHTGGGIDETRRGVDALTELGTTVGTIAYMSPEQLRGEPLDVRSDLFSFGLVLYQMATGQRAFGGATSAVVSSAILVQEPAPPTAARPDLPPRLEEIILKALEKDRQTRCQSAAEIRADLMRLKRHSGSETTRVAVPAPPAAQNPSVSRTQAGGRRGLMIVVGVIAGIAILAGGYWMGVGRNTGDAPMPPASPPLASATPAPPPSVTPAPTSTPVPTPSSRPTPTPTSAPPSLPTPTSAPTSSPRAGTASEPPTGRAGRGAPGGRRGGPAAMLPTLVGVLKNLPPVEFNLLYPPGDQHVRDLALGLRGALVNSRWTCVSTVEGPNSGVPLSMFVPQPSPSVNALVTWAWRNGFDPQVHQAPRAPRLRIVFGK